MLYIRNQKVASHVIVTAMRRQFGPRAGGAPLYRYPYRTADDPQRRTYPRNSADGQPMYVFSLVDDPLRVAQRGYLEVSRRYRGQSAYRNLSCATRPEDRYAAFLRSVSNGEPLGPELFHAFPQALKLSAATRFDRVWSLGALDEAAAALKGDTGVDLFDALQPGRVSGRSFNGSEWGGCAGSVNLNKAPEVARLFCRLYAIDYECGLGFERPSVCMQWT